MSTLTLLISLNDVEIKAAFFRTTLMFKNLRFTRLNHNPLLYSGPENMIIEQALESKETSARKHGTVTGLTTKHSF